MPSPGANRDRDGEASKEGELFCVVRDVSDSFWFSCTQQSLDRKQFSPLRRIENITSDATPSKYPNSTGVRSNGSVVPQQVDAKEAWGSSGMGGEAGGHGGPLHLPS